MKKFTFVLLVMLICTYLFSGCDHVSPENSDGPSTNDTFDTSAEHTGDCSEDDLQRVYRYRESDDVVKPTITLWGDNKFSFTFSALSSYLGIGTYTIDDDFLVLNTDDGIYTYTFKIEGENMNRLIFSAEKSSKTTHLGKFEDGAVFE